jgi:methyl-accepting chemotaxis protein
MKFRQSAPAVLIGAVIVVIATISVVSNIISHRMAASFEATQFELMEKIMHSKLHGAEGKAIAAAESIAAMPAVRKAFAAQQRDELLAVTRDAFKVQHEKYGISQAQFHLAPAMSFLRVHNPEKFGDDQAKFRQMVVEVNRANGIRKGIEITTSGIGIFGTMPVTDAAGKAIGSFEPRLSISHFERARE